MSSLQAHVDREQGLDRFLSSPTFLVSLITRAVDHILESYDPSGSQEPILRPALLETVSIFHLCLVVSNCSHLHACTTHIVKIYCNDVS